MYGTVSHAGDGRSYLFASSYELESLHVWDRGPFRMALRSWQAWAGYIMSGTVVPYEGILGRQVDNLKAMSL